MPIALSSQSILRLNAVHPTLKAVVLRMQTHCDQMCAIAEGLRTREAQYADFLRHASKLNGTPQGQTTPEGTPGTGKGNHQIQEDGFGHAVDIVPLVRGAYRWEWPLIYPIAAAMQRAAQELNTPLRWGGVWDRVLNELPMTPDPITSLQTAVSSYVSRHAGPDFLDGPHFELHS